MVFKLEGLLAHLKGVREMASRLTTLKDSVPAAVEEAPAAPAAPPRAVASTERQGGKWAEDLSPTLHALAERLAKDHHKRFKLTMTGLAEVPSSYISTVKDCVIQMLRNSAVHGIESSDIRRAQTKDDVGVV